MCRSGAWLLRWGWISCVGLERCSCAGDRRNEPHNLSVWSWAPARCVKINTTSALTPHVSVWSYALALGVDLMCRSGAELLRWGSKGITHKPHVSVWSKALALGVDLMCRSGAKLFRWGSDCVERLGRSSCARFQCTRLGRSSCVTWNVLVLKHEQDCHPPIGSTRFNCAPAVRVQSGSGLRSPTV